MKIKVIIDKVKVTNYLLNINHPEGQSKAIFFKLHGFDQQRPKQFQNAIKSHFYVNLGTAISVETAYGIKILIQGPIETPIGKEVFIKSVWFQELNSDFVKLVTAYPSND